MCFIVLTTEAMYFVIIIRHRELTNIPLITVIKKKCYLIEPFQYGRALIPRNRLQVGII